MLAGAQVLVTKHITNFVVPETITLEMLRFLFAEVGSGRLVITEHAPKHFTYTTTGTPESKVFPTAHAAALHAFRNTNVHVN